MRVFSDAHHGSLYNSTQIICDRLGYELYRPIGMDWFNYGFFGIAEPYGNAMDTIKQFLEFSTVPVVNSAPAYNYEPVPTHIGTRVYDISSENFNLAISLEEFRDTKFDVIIASVPAHIDKYWALRNTYQPNAKLVFQIGNPGWSPPDSQMYPNILDSVGVFTDNERDNYRYLLYHQPFDTDIFHPTSDAPSKTVSSFVIFPEGDTTLFGRVSQLLPEFDFVGYGHSGYCNRQPITGVSNIAEVMRTSSFGWHQKLYDGYGHIIHNWAACGKPVLCNYSAYSTRQAGNLLSHKQTGFNLDGASSDAVAEFIKETTSDSALYQHLCDNMTQRFQQYCDFEFELAKLKDFFEGLR